MLAATLAWIVTSPQVHRPLEPREYASPNGVHRLEVDPTERFGAGLGWHRLISSGREAWAGSLPFTLQRALVSDAGVVVGHAATRGSFAGDGHVLVVCIDPSGKARILDAVARRSPQEIHGSATPILGEMRWQADSSRFSIAGVAGREWGSRTWRYGVDDPAIPVDPWQHLDASIAPSAPPSVAGRRVELVLEALPAALADPIDVVVLGSTVEAARELRPVAFDVADDGAFLVLDARSQRMLAFEPDGRARAATPRLDVSRRTGLVADARGGAWIEEFEDAFRFDRDGRLVDACRDTYRSPLLRERAVLAGQFTGWHVALDFADAAVVSPEGRFVHRLRRGADRRWVERCLDASIADDGTTLLLEPRSAGGLRAHVADASGRTFLTLDLVADRVVHAARVRPTGSRFLVHVPRLGALEIDPARAEVRCIRLGDDLDPPGRILDVVPLPVGASLAALDAGAGIVRRFARVADRASDSTADRK